jgi:hypothetical protein
MAIRPCDSHCQNRIRQASRLVKPGWLLECGTCGFTHPLKIVTAASEIREKTERKLGQIYLIGPI